MKRSKFSEEQITYALRQHEAGTPGQDIRSGLALLNSQIPFYKWIPCRFMPPTAVVAG